MYRSLWTPSPLEVFSSSGEESLSSLDNKVNQFEDLVEENSGGSFGPTIPQTNYSDYQHYHFNGNTMDNSGSFDNSRPTSRGSNYQSYQFNGKYSS